MWKADRDGSNRVQLTRPPVSASSPHWSPDSKQILFTGASAVNVGIYVVFVEGGSPQRLSPEVTANSYDADWSPDGTRVVFDRERLPKNVRELCILDLASRRIDAIPGSSGFSYPRWSLDGRYIAALDSGASDIHVLNLKTQRWTTLTVEGDEELPSFSHDSRFIYFLHLGSDQGVFRISVTGGKAERVADLKHWHLTGYFGYSMSLDPTDAPLVLRDAGSDDIYALTMSVK